ncbi:MAG: cation:proton antiporter, partial [Candidatus Aenigmarchaeota archaeon]|nr:cation:proton antiporter [Candidatus Aenigmarchaeota archaeon]
MEYNILFLLALILIASRVFEEIAARLNQPIMVGNILAGVLLGPAFLNVLVSSSILEFFGLLGVMFLMVLAGLEVNLKDLKTVTGTASMVAIFGSLVPVVTGIALGLLFGMNIFEAAMIGVAISITASIVSVEMLEQIGCMRKKIGETLITAGVLNEIISLF